MIGRKYVRLPDGTHWIDPTALPRTTWVCGYCGESIASVEGWFAGVGGSSAKNGYAFIRLCPNCDGPTFFSHQGGRYPGSSPGQDVKNSPQDVTALYNEARLCAAANAHTAAVLCCRKILMHIAVERGAEEDKPFAYYVKHLKAKGFVPPGSEGWVDYIRTRGNEANHEIEVMTEEDAIALIRFVEMLLRLIYEFPAMVPGAGGQDAATRADAVT